MRVYLPNSAFLNNIENFVKVLETDDPNHLELTGHPSWIHVHPLVVAMTAAMGENVPAENVALSSLTAKSVPYLERMGLFKFIGLPASALVQEHEPAGRFIPLTKIASSSEQTAFITEIIPLLHLTPQQAEPIRYILSELIRNVLEHAGTSSAVVCAQYYPKTNTLRLGVVDRGMGLAASLRHSYAVEDDVKAIRLALTPGVTGTTRRLGGTEYNAGAGLFFTKSIARMSRSFFVIYSGTALYKLNTTSNGTDIRLRSDPFADKHTLREGLPFWQGTAVGIDIKLDMGEPFEDFLQRLREILKKAIKERKAQRTKEAKFI